MRQPMSSEDVAIIQDAIDRLPVPGFHDQRADDQRQAIVTRNFGELARGTEYTKPGERWLPEELTDAFNMGSDRRVLVIAHFQSVSGAGVRFEDAGPYRTRDVHTRRSAWQKQPATQFAGRGLDRDRLRLNPLPNPIMA